MEETASSEFNYLPVIQFTIIFPIVVGILLRLPQLFLEIKENKRWVFDWPKFIAVGLPTLLILFYYISITLGWVPIVDFIIISGETILTIIGIIFGYTLVDCLKE